MPTREERTNKVSNLSSSPEDDTIRRKGCKSRLPTTHKSISTFEHDKF